MQPLKVPATLVLTATAAFVIDLAALLAFALNAWPSPLPAVVHLLLSAALVARTCRSPKWREDLRLPMLLTVMTAFTGPFGAGGVLLTMALAGRYAKSTPPFEVWYAALFPEASGSSHGLSQAVQQMGQQGHARARVTPFADVLCFGALSQKQELISLISKHFRPSFAPVLRMAINDTNNGIRVQAASALTKIADEFLPRTVELAAAREEDPSDPALVLKIAELHDEYVSAGMLDGEREQDSRRRALAAYTDYVALQPDDLQARASAARLLISEGHYDEAVKWLEGCLHRDNIPADVHLLYMESLFHLKRSTDLRRVAASLWNTFAGDADISADISIEERETVRLWAGVA